MKLKSFGFLVAFVLGIVAVPVALVGARVTPRSSYDIGSYRKAGTAGFNYLADVGYPPPPDPVIARSTGDVGYPPPPDPAA